MRAIRTLCLALASTALLAGCGGSDDHKQALDKVTAELATTKPFSDPALVQCMKPGLDKLSTSQLKSLANASGSATQSQLNEVVPIAGACLRQGKGVGPVRQAVIAGINSAPAAATLPPAYVKCVVAKASTIPNNEVAQLLLIAVGGNGQAQAQALGVRLGGQCLTEPAVLNALTQRFLAPIESSVSSGQFSPAFGNCLLAKAKAVPAQTILKLALNPAASRANGQALGRQWARECIASGAKP